MEKTEGDENERTYERIVQHVAAVIMRLDREGSTTFMNGYGQDLFGYTVEELIGRSLNDTIVPHFESTGVISNGCYRISSGILRATSTTTTRT